MNITLPHTGFYLILLAAALLPAPPRAAARTGAAEPTLALLSESRVWIEGRSSVNSFKCAADNVKGGGRMAAARGIASASAMVWLEVPVAAFDCGNARMNSDLLEAMKAEAFPLIRFELIRAEVTAASADTYRVGVVGAITVAGVSRTVRTETIAFRREDGTFRARGLLELTMTDFGIEPPTAMFGLIKARDEIRVRFDLVAAPSVDGGSVGAENVPLPSIEGRRLGG